VDLDREQNLIMLRHKGLGSVSYDGPRMEPPGKKPRQMKQIPLTQEFVFKFSYSMQYYSCQDYAILRLQ